MRRDYGLDVVAHFAQPDPEIKTILGKDWARVHPRVCPWCGSVFYAWAPIDAAWERFVVEPDPHHMSKIKNRETCGRSGCIDQEDSHQWSRRKPSDNPML